MILLLAIVSSVTLAMAQTAEAPYKRFPEVPPFQLLLSDSATMFTKDMLKKNKATIVMLFSPTCEHCQHEVKEMLKNKTAFKNVQIVMSTLSSISEMNQFYKDYHLDQLPDVTIGKDVRYILPPFYQLHNFPFLAFYDRKKQLVSVFEGSMPMDKLKVELEKAGG